MPKEEPAFRRANLECDSELSLYNTDELMEKCDVSIEVANRLIDEVLNNVDIEVRANKLLVFRDSYVTNDLLDHSLATSNAFLYDSSGGRNLDKVNCL